tara:strand:- start:11 stop:271 length:261 start_codon:yes stop_codon:yes gene_type:complete
MANYSFITGTANIDEQVDMQNQSVEYKETTATAVIPGPWSSAIRANSPTDVVQNFNISGLDRTIRGFMQGRRPAYNLKFPRGYYNK